MNQATKPIALELIRIDGGTQSRVELNEDVVQDYCEAFAANAKFRDPPIVFFDGSDYWLADGFHRYHAAHRAKRTELDCEVRNGTKRDAVFFSVGANANHGLRRTNADKRRAVTTLLDDPEWNTWSDHLIAKACGVGHQLVGDVRAKLFPDSDSDLTGFSSSEKKRKYLNKHGTVSEMEVKFVVKRSDEEGPAEISEEVVTPATPKIVWKDDAATAQASSAILKSIEGESLPGRESTSKVKGSHLTLIEGGKEATEIARLQARITELKDEIRFVRSQLAEISQENALMAKSFEGDEPLLAALEEGRRAYTELKVAKEQFHGQVNLNNELRRRLKRLENKAKADRRTGA